MMFKKFPSHCLKMVRQNMSLQICYSKPSPLLLLRTSVCITVIPKQVMCDFFQLNQTLIFSTVKTIKHDFKTISTKIEIWYQLGGIRHHKDIFKVSVLMPLTMMSSSHRRPQATIVERQRDHNVRQVELD